MHLHILQCAQNSYVTTFKWLIIDLLTLTIELDSIKANVGYRSGTSCSWTDGTTLSHFRKRSFNLEGKESAQWVPCCDKHLLQVDTSLLEAKAYYRPDFSPLYYKIQYIILYPGPSENPYLRPGTVWTSIFGIGVYTIQCTPIPKNNWLVAHVQC